jgi:hypothetical protein
VYGRTRAIDQNNWKSELNKLNELGFFLSHFMCTLITMNMTTLTLPVPKIEVNFWNLEIDVERD